MSEWFLVLSLLIVGVGVALVWVGYVFGIVGVMWIRTIWGIISMFVPAVAIVCFVIYRSQLKYPLRMISAGLLLLAISAPVTYHFAWEYTGSFKP